MTYKFKRKPRTYQLAALQKMLKLGVLALWFDPGLGKTKVAIDFIAIKRMTDKLTKVLVVCPLSAIGVWEDEVPLDYPEDLTTFKITPVVGDMVDRIRLMQKVQITTGPQIVVINYDSLRNDRIAALIQGWRPEFLIVDEMHYCKNHRTLRSKAVLRIRKQAKWAIGLTGTPMPKNPLDIFGQYLILDHRVFGEDYDEFAYHFAVFNQMFRTKVDRWKNLDELAKKVHTIAYRTRDDECKTLPELIIQNVPVFLTDKTKKVYKGMVDEMVAELDDYEVVTASMAAVKVGKLQQLTGGFIIRTDKYLDENKQVVKQRVYFPVGTEKLDVFMDLIDVYVENHKILVGCRFIWEVTQIQARLTKKGIDHVVIKGGVSGEERILFKNRFQNDEKCRVIVFQVAAATAMTLTAGDIGILYSCTTNWSDYFQWLKRIHREGQTKPVYILRLVAKGTVDLDIIRNLETKGAFITDIVDKSKFREMLRLKE